MFGCTDRVGLNDGRAPGCLPPDAGSLSAPPSAPWVVAGRSVGSFGWLIESTPYEASCPGLWLECGLLFLLLFYIYYFFNNLNNIYRIIRDS